jgi:outer membrane protein W
MAAQFIGEYRARRLRFFCIVISYRPATYPFRGQKEIAMRSGTIKAFLAVAPLPFGLLGWQESASAENFLSLYTGTSFTRDSTLRITQGGAGTDLVLRDVGWDADPFKLAPYYGLRFTHFFDRHPNWGLALDFTHYKMYAQTNRAVPVNGIWKGAAVNAVAPMNQYVQHFEISHGVNMGSVNGIYRWLNSRFADGRLQPYVGAGISHYWLHSENTVDNMAHETGYQASGFGVHLFGGVHYQLSKRIGAFAEAKFNRGTAKVDVANGGAETPLRTFHALAGLSYRF